MYESYKQHFVIIEFNSAVGRRRAIAWFADCNATHVQLEAPSTREPYTVLVSNIIEINLMSENKIDWSKVHPSLRRPEQKQEGK
ncbi:MAG: hypothetical protein KGH64_03260 [Candidatus Micrarchaeota archaeon]|nr:hypothetical protein [Candidatus Micrarchaeota archaeon]MDE1834331.1 hypothetical protein [Candidatus Micrarchaeota archaeon]MDE1859194.1 hypothetical protein [Candidatus Micrarchaeota archaeon]